MQVTKPKGAIPKTSSIARRGSQPPHGHDHANLEQAPFAGEEEEELESDASEDDDSLAKSLQVASANSVVTGHYPDPMLLLCVVIGALRFSLLFPFCFPPSRSGCLCTGITRRRTSRYQAYHRHALRQIQRGTCR